MNEEQNPFAAPGARSQRADASRHLWTMMGILAVIVAGVVAWLAFQQQGQRLKQLRQELDELRAGATRAQAQAAELKDKLLSSQSRMADLNEKLASSQSRV